MCSVVSKPAKSHPIMCGCQCVVAFDRLANKQRRKTYDHPPWAPDNIRYGAWASINSGPCSAHLLVSNSLVIFGCNSTINYQKHQSTPKKIQCNICKIWVSMSTVILAEWIYYDGCMEAKYSNMLFVFNYDKICFLPPSSGYIRQGYNIYSK